MFRPLPHRGSRRGPGLIQRFEFTHELAWNVLKDYFTYQGTDNITGSRDETREAFNKGLIEDGIGWMEMIKSRTRHLRPYPRVAEIERLIAIDMGFHRFIPYTQLHEYEALMYTDTHLLEEWLGLYNTLPKDCFTKIRAAAPDGNPELINEGRETAPSKRIVQLCDTYDKVGDGILILKEIGLNKLRVECRHFNEWLTKLESLGGVPI